jgi:hypothetical protein
MRIRGPSVPDQRGYALSDSGGCIRHGADDWDVAQMCLIGCHRNAGGDRQEQGRTLRQSLQNRQRLSHDLRFHRYQNHSRTIAETLVEVHTLRL